MSGDIPTVLADACPICSQEFCEHTDDERAEFNRARASGQEAPYVSSDPGDVAKKGRSSKAGEKRDRADLKWLLSDERGRRFMWALISRCGVYRSSFAVSHGEHAGMSFLEGERNIGLEYLLRCVNENPSLYAAMVKENGGGRA